MFFIIPDCLGEDSDSLIIAIVIIFLSLGDNHL